MGSEELFCSCRDRAPVSGPLIGPGGLSPRACTVLESRTPSSRLVHPAPCGSRPASRELAGGGL